jgi:YbgC/YbaW family acyl-CoA thioester hydrolase
MVSHCERFRVGWIDTDASGRIHHTAAFRWVEATEVALFRKLGLLDGGVGRWPRRHVEAEYLQALAFDQGVEVCLNVASVGTSSVTFEWRISRDSESVVEGRHTVVQVDGDGQPLPLSDDARDALIHGRELVRPTPGSA